MSTVNFTYKGTDYSLGFNRKSVKSLESQGFELEKLGSMPQTMIPLLFNGAFAANHKNIKRKLIDEIWEALGDKTDLILELTELYAETINDLMTDGDDEGEMIAWTRTE